LSCDPPFKVGETLGKQIAIVLVELGHDPCPIEGLGYYRGG
jgi:hypothetical protein